MSDYYTTESHAFVDMLMQLALLLIHAVCSVISFLFSVIPV